MSIWIASAAIITVIAAFPLWKPIGTVIPILLIIEATRIGPNSWAIPPLSDGPPKVPVAFVYFTVICLLYLFKQRRLEPTNAIVKLVLGISFLLGILLYSSIFPFILEQGVLLYSLSTLGLFIGLPLGGVSVLNKVRKTE